MTLRLRVRVPRARRALALASLPLALVLAGCSGSSGGGASSTASATGSATGSATPTQSGTTAASASPEPISTTVSADLDKAQVTYTRGKAPTIKLPSAPWSPAPGYRVLAAGDGATITDAQSLVLDYFTLNAKDGKELESSFAQSRQATLSLSDASLLPAIRTALVNQKVGTQVLVAVPASSVYGTQTSTVVSSADTILFFFDVRSARTPLTTATGTAVPPKAGLPTVVMGKTAADPAVITVPKGYKAPKTTVVQPLITGTGATVVAGQTVRVTYTGVTLANPGTPFDYSGKSTQGYYETTIGAGSVIKAWDKAIVGKPVGSRLLIIAPPADAYPSGNGTIKATDTLVFVVDILDAG